MKQRYRLNPDIAAEIENSTYTPPEECSHLPRVFGVDYQGPALNPLQKQDRRFLIKDIDATLKQLVNSEDTDGDCRITIDDQGPKSFKLQATDLSGYHEHEIKGTYQLSNFLQELILAKRLGKNSIILNEAQLIENPVKRLKRLISTNFWNALSRRLDSENLYDIASDTKIESSVVRLYVPYDCDSQYKYFSDMVYQINSEHQVNPNFKPMIVERLPADITPEFVKLINDKPGLLSLAMQPVAEYLPKEAEKEKEKVQYFEPNFNDRDAAEQQIIEENEQQFQQEKYDSLVFYGLNDKSEGSNTSTSSFVSSSSSSSTSPFTSTSSTSFSTPSPWSKANESTRSKQETLRALPYVIPGGRFNELYGWDSYMMALGLLVDGRLDLVIGIIEHFIFEIKHYGKILNANRTYYLNRSQPPFLTDLARKTYTKLLENQDSVSFAKDLLKRAILASIKEYKTVWCCLPRLDDETGLSKYNPDGIGVPPETERHHFDVILSPFAIKNGIQSIDEFVKLYNSGLIREPELDEYFLNDRAVRELGHDTSYRLDGLCAHLCTVDLNSLLYKYEMDIAEVIEYEFDDHLLYVDSNHQEFIQTSADWFEKANIRKRNFDKYLWNEKEFMWFDYNAKTKSTHFYESATAFYPIWAGLASERQVKLFVENSLSKFEEFGGIVSCTLKSRGFINPIYRPAKQWDYPFGWAPHQILAWKGLLDYGYAKDSQRLAYRWLSLIMKSFVDYNGMVVEKYDVTNVRDPHKVQAEYGNQGENFRGVVTEGFGWVNSSFEIGLLLLDDIHMKALHNVISPSVLYINDNE